MLATTQPDGLPISLGEVSWPELRRAAELDPLTWALLYRRIHGEDFTVIPPLVDVYCDQAREVCVAKAAQVFVSEWAINLALWVADTAQGRRGNALYVFPTKEHLGDFVRERIDGAVEESEYLTRRVRPTRGLEPIGKAADNVGLKRVGLGFIYFRGSNAEAGLISVPADLVIYDEVDRLRARTTALAAKRLGSSLLGWQRYLGTPTYPEVGIDGYWLRSDRRRYHIKCEHCGEWQALSFPDNVREDGQAICRACHLPINRLAVGEWVAECPGRDLHGYHMTKLLSPRADLPALAKLGYAILNRDVTDPSAIQEFYNQDLGLPHAPEGGQLSRAELEACVVDYSLGDWTPAQCWMGVDVGAKLHVTVAAPSPEGNGKTRLAFIGTVPGWDDLPGLMRRFDVSACVVDAEPEHHAALQFASDFTGRVWLCRYPNVTQWAHGTAAVWDDEEATVAAHRTLTLDATFAAIRERQIELPREAQHIPGFYEQMMAPIRVLQKDARGLEFATYVEGGKADHYAHSFLYCRLAALRPAQPAVSPSMFGVVAGRRR